VAAILASLSPLAELLLQADDPVELAQSVLAEVQAGATAGGALEGRLISEVHDGGLVLPAMVLADIVDLATHTVCPGALIPAAQLVAIVEARVSADHWQLALTIPAFVRGPFADMVADLPSPLRPIETVPAMHMIAGKARERLVLAAPYLHPAFVTMFIPHVKRIAQAGGTVALITRALSALSPQHSQANIEALEVLRHATSARDLLVVRSWEEDGLGVHFKAVVADEHMAYLGSANLTPAGGSAHAEAGVLLSGPSVSVLARWLQVVSTALGERRFPNPKRP